MKDAALSRPMLGGCAAVAAAVCILATIAIVALELTWTRTSHAPVAVGARAELLTLVRSAQVGVAASALLAIALGALLVAALARRLREAAVRPQPIAAALHPELHRPRFSPCNARTLVEAALHPFQSQARGSAVRLRAAAPVDLLVHVDREHIVQVLQILIGTSLRCSRSGGEITTSVQAIDGWIRFAVADAGPHVIPDEISWSFESGNPRAGGGGALLSRQLVEAHHGRIGVERVIGRGSTFWFVLPNQPALFA